MKKTTVVVGLLIIGLLLTVTSAAMAADWRFPLALSYINGANDIVDRFEDNLEAEGFLVVDDVSAFPVGFTFHPYAQLDSGLRMGTGIGPIMLIYGDRDFLNIPVNLNVGFTFFPTANTSPYVRGGIMYHFASGDYVKSKSPGFFGAIGIEFFKKSTIGFGIEVGYDTSEVEFEKKERVGGFFGSQSVTTEDIQPIALMVSFMAIF